MNFKNAPRLRKIGQIRRWSLHDDDYIPLLLNEVDFSEVDPLRADLYYLNCQRMPRVILDQMEAHMASLWTSLKWANEQADAHFSNCFKTGEIVPVYNSNRLVLPTVVRHSLKISVQGVHCDFRRGRTFSPIIIMEELIPLIRFGGKQMTLPAVVEDELEEESEDEHEPPVKRKRVRFTPQFSDEPSTWDDEVTSEQNSLPESDAPQAEWITDWLQEVHSPQLPSDQPHMQTAVQPPAHPRLRDQNSKDKWLKTTETARKQYYRCARHGGYLCPDCTVHVPNWEIFVEDHYGCSAFSAVTKSVICDISI